MRGQLANPLDGRYGPIDNAAFQFAIDQLVEDAALDGIDYILGIPEGGMVPAYAFGAAVGLPVVFASMWRPDLPGVIQFSEDHDTPAVKTKSVYGLSPTNRVLIVEDEVTTGSTVINCVLALRAAAISCDQVFAIYASDDPELRVRLEAHQIKLKAVSLFSKTIGDGLI